MLQLMDMLPIILVSTASEMATRIYTHTSIHTQTIFLNTHRSLLVEKTAFISMRLEHITFP